MTNLQETWKLNLTVAEYTNILAYLLQNTKTSWMPLQNADILINRSKKDIRFLGVCKSEQPRIVFKSACPKASEIILIDFPISCNYCKKSLE